MSNKEVWPITGAGRGMGVDFAKTALSAGHAVVANGRDRDAISKALGQSETLLTVTLDVTKPADAEAAVRAAIERFGRIDVLVNSAASFYAGSAGQGALPGAGHARTIIGKPCAEKRHARFERGLWKRAGVERRYRGIIYQSTNMQLQPGDKLWPYEILEPLGKSAKGEVWKASDTRLNRIVAMKASKQQWFWERHAECQMPTRLRSKSRRGSL